MNNKREGDKMSEFMPCFSCTQRECYKCEHYTTSLVTGAVETKRPDIEEMKQLIKYIHALKEKEKAFDKEVVLLKTPADCTYDLLCVPKGRGRTVALLARVNYNNELLQFMEPVKPGDSSDE